MSVEPARIRKVAEAARKFHDDPEMDYYGVAEMYLSDNPEETDEAAAQSVAMMVAFP